MTGDKLQLTADEAQEIANVLAAHRQQHNPETGASDCLCGKWEGPFTVLAGSDPRSYAAHVTAALAPTIADMIAAHRVEALVMDDLASDETVLLGPDS